MNRPMRPRVDGLPFFVVQDLVLQDWSTASRHNRALQPDRTRRPAGRSCEDIAEKRLVEPRRANRAARVGDERFEDLEAWTARGSQATQLLMRPTIETVCLGRIEAMGWR